MTAQDNLKTALSFIDGFNTRDMSAWAAKLAPGYSADYPGAFGADAQAARQFNESFMPAFPDLHFNVVRTLIDGDAVVIEWTAGGTHDGPLTSAAGQVIPPTHRSGLIHGVLISNVKNGQISHERTYWDQMELLGVLGLVPA